MERKAGRNRRTDQVQGEEFVYTTDNMGICKLAKHIILEIIEVRCLQWEPILGNVSRQQKYLCKQWKAFRQLQRQGREGKWGQVGDGECVSIWISHMKFKKGK